MALFESYNTGDDSDVTFKGSGIRIGQAIMSSITHTITSVKLLLSKAGTPGPLVTVTIQGESNSKPDGTPIASGTIAITEFPDAPTEFSEIEFETPVELDADTPYWIVVDPGSGDDSNYITWRADKSSPTYENGVVATSNDGGSNWTLEVGWDMMFEEYGYVSSVQGRPFCQRG